MPSTRDRGRPAKMPLMGQLAAPIEVWVRAATGASGVEVQGDLAGSSTGQLTVVLADGIELVLRRYTNPAIIARHPDLPAAEARALRAVAGSGLLVPELLAVDPDGAAVGVPALLMTRLDGAPLLNPPERDRSRWIDDLASVTAQVHGAPLASTPLPPVEPWFEPDRFTVPPWSSEPDGWRQVFAELVAPMPPAPEVLVHRDLHPGNVLWNGGAVSGIVDWVNAGAGSAAADLARCRTNLAVIGSVAEAELFLDRYHALTGGGGEDQRWWDLADLAATVKVVAGVSMVAGYLAMAHAGVDIDETKLHARLDAHLRAVLG